MLREEDLIVQRGRCDGGSFLRLVHAPTDIVRMCGPLAGANANDLLNRWEQEIEHELREKGLTQYIVPTYRRKKNDSR